MGAPASFLSNWLIPRLERFEAAHPDIRIRLQTAADAALLNTRRVDALILAGRDWPREWAVTPLLAEATGPVCAPAWAARLSRPADVLDAPLLHTSSRPEAWQDWAGRVGVKLAPRHPGREFDHLGHMLEAAAAGWAWPSRRPCWLRPSCIAAASPRRWASSIGAAFSLCTLKAQDGAPPARLRDWLLADAAAV